MLLEGLLLHRERLVGVSTLTLLASRKDREVRVTTMATPAARGERE